MRYKSGLDGMRSALLYMLGMSYLTVGGGDDEDVMYGMVGGDNSANKRAWMAKIFGAEWSQAGEVQQEWLT